MDTGQVLKCLRILPIEYQLPIGVMEVAVVALPTMQMEPSIIITMGRVSVKTTVSARASLTLLSLAMLALPVSRSFVIHSAGVECVYSESKH